MIPEGALANPVVFDLHQLEDTADFGRPFAHARGGIDRVIVSGEVVVEEGHLTGSRPGRIAP